MKSMELFLILVLVAEGTHALSPVDETTCNVTKNTCPCSALLEGTVYIQVMTDASGREVKCLKVLPSGPKTVFNLKKGRITTDKEFNNRLQFIINNGTLKLTNVRRNDSGQYRVEVFNSEGVQEKKVNFTLDVKDSGRVEENSFPFLLIVCAVLGFLLIVVSCCFMCREVKHCKKSGNMESQNKKRCVTENMNLKYEFEP